MFNNLYNESTSGSLSTKPCTIDADDLFCDNLNCTLSCIFVRGNPLGQHFLFVAKCLNILIQLLLVSLIILAVLFISVNALSKLS